MCAGAGEGYLVRERVTWCGTLVRPVDGLKYTRVDGVHICPLWDFGNMDWTKVDILFLEK